MVDLHWFVGFPGKSPEQTPPFLSGHKGCNTKPTRGGAAFQHGWSGHQKTPVVLSAWLDERFDSHAGHHQRTEIWADETCHQQIGSVIQWYESLDKYPVAIGKLSGLKEKSQELSVNSEGQT